MELCEHSNHYHCLQCEVKYLNYVIEELLEENEQLKNKKKKPKFIEDDETVEYKKRLKEFMEQVNPKPTLEDLEKLKEKYLKVRGE